MVQKVRVSSSIELYDNRSDASRVYDIEADVHVRGNVTNSMDGGSVTKDGVQVAQFNSWEQNHLNVTYMGVDVDEQNGINEAVNVFIGEVKADVSGRKEA